MTRRLTIAIGLTVLVLGWTRAVSVQSGIPLYRGTTLPSTNCDQGQLYVLTATDGANSPGFYYCDTPGSWLKAGWTGGTSVPSGAVIFIDTGTCPSGYSEDSNLSGKTIVGTIAANGDVGTTGGSDTITPAGTNGAPSFTGTAWAAPAVSWPAGVPTFSGNSVTSSAVSAGTPAGTNAASATSGNCAATNIAAGTGSTTACKATAPNLTVTAQTFTGSALGTHTHTTTATGTVAWPAGVPTLASYTPAGSVAAPAFTGTQFDNRSAFVKVIACKKS